MSYDSDSRKKADVEDDNGKVMPVVSENVKREETRRKVPARCEGGSTKCERCT